MDRHFDVRPQTEWAPITDDNLAPGATTSRNEDRQKTLNAINGDDPLIEQILAQQNVRTAKPSARNAKIAVCRRKLYFCVLRTEKQIIVG